MPNYEVAWVIDVDESNPVEAAELARDCQRGNGSWATVFQVRDRDTDELWIVDLTLGTSELVP